MEHQPTTELAKSLLEILKNWMEKSPEWAVDKLKRVFLTCSLEIQNEDKFVTLLCGQGVLDESPSALSERFATPLLRAQYAMETALNQGCVKELVVAFELSQNGSVLAGVQKWTEENSNEITEAMKSRRMLSKLTPGTEVKRRTREINLRLKDKNNAKLYVVEVCHDKIIIGWDSGQIEIYSSTHLGRETVLNSYRSPVVCLQCTCTEIIAGYENGNIWVWNIEKGTLLHELSIQEKREHARCMRWRAPRLVVVTTNNKVKIWEYYGTSITLLCNWQEKLGPLGVILHADLYEKCVIVQVAQAGYPDCVSVKDWNGQQICSISFQHGLRSAALDINYVITFGHDNVLGIWDISTGACLKELGGRHCSFDLIGAHGGVFGASCKKDAITRTFIWNVEAVLEGKERLLADFSHDNFPSANWPVFKLGQNIIVTGCGLKDPTIKVTDFMA